MTKFTATFADGTTITRGSAHAYTVAWRATWVSDSGRTTAVTGFAVSRERAKPCRPSWRLIHRGMSANDRAAAVRENSDRLARSGYAVEFAPAMEA